MPNGSRPNNPSHYYYKLTIIKVNNLGLRQPGHSRLRIQITAHVARKTAQQTRAELGLTSDQTHYRSYWGRDCSTTTTTLSAGVVICLEQGWA